MSFPAADKYLYLTEINWTSGNTDQNNLHIKTNKGYKFCYLPNREEAVGIKCRWRCDIDQTNEMD